MRHKVTFRAYMQPSLRGTTSPYIDKESWGKIGANCHIFKIVDLKHYLDKYALGQYKQFGITLVAGEQVQEEWLFGPASLRNKTLIYPCEAFKCQMECPCQMCRMKLSECDDFDDHLTFHLANHTMCKYCNEVERCFPHFSYNVVHNREYPDRFNDKIWYDTMGSASLIKHTSWYTAGMPFSEDYSHYTCDKCEKKFKMRSHLKRHEVAVHYKKKEVCQYCGFQCSRKDNLVAHMRLIHEGETGPQFECEVCNHAFHKRSDLVRHSKHLKSRCSICADIFCTLKQLQQHNRMSNSKYACGKCGKGFQDQANLDKHQSTSTSSTKCEVCDKEHCTVLELNKHKKTHVKDSFQCNLCNKKFASKFCHKRHMEQRNDLKCSQCGEGMCNKQELKMHISQAHNVKSCEICHKVFDLKNYKYHMYSEHQKAV